MASPEQAEDMGISIAGPEMVDATGAGALLGILLFGFMYWASENFTNHR